tara:strand:+ start:220 stop:786 length:567 start_codon:yes stop_codon:yes gene_type:complete
MIRNDDEMIEKIDMDELYQKKHEIEEHRRKIYNKILNRAHTKIKTTSRLKHQEQFCFYIVPEFMLGVPKYNLSECVGYVIEKLIDNGFSVKYTEPNLLFISWQHFIPFYKREEIKKTHGVTIDGFGNVIKKKNQGHHGHQGHLGSSRRGGTQMKDKKTANRNFKSTADYKSSGLIYDDNLLKNMNNLF